MSWIITRSGKRFDLLEPAASMIDPDLPPCVHDGDLIALATEKRDLMADHPDAWPYLTGTNPAQFRIKPMTQAEACQAYFNRLMELLATTHRARAAA